MKKIIILIIALVFLTGCSITSTSQNSNFNQELVTENSDKSSEATIESSPINNASDAKTAVDDLTKDIDKQMSELNTVSDFTDTTDQDFAQ